MDCNAEDETAVPGGVPARSGRAIGGGAASGSVNGQLGFGQYVCDEERETFTAHSISVLTLDGARIAGITSPSTASPLRAPEGNRP